MNIDFNHYYAVYIVTNKKEGTLYIGVTNNLERRIYEHKHKLIKGFTNQYNLYKLVLDLIRNDKSSCF